MNPDVDSQNTPVGFIRKYSFLFSVIICSLLVFFPFNKIMGINIGYCIHKELLGFECPACGIRSALKDLLQCNVGTAIQDNSAIFPLIVFISPTQEYPAACGGDELCRNCQRVREHGDRKHHLNVLNHPDTP